MNSIRAFSSCVFFTVLLFHFYLPVAVAQTSLFWSTYQRDSRHSGLSPFVGPQTDTVKWTLDVFDAPAPSVGPNGLIYLALCSPESQCWNWKLIAVNPDGTIAFQTATYFGRAGSFPTIADDGTIYVGTRTSSGQDHDLYAFYPDGSFKWKMSLPAFSQSVTLASDGTVYVPWGGGWPTQGKLLALNPDGTSKWTYDYGQLQSLNAVAVASNGNIIVTGISGGFHTIAAAHSPVDGSQLWLLDYPTLPAPGAISPPAVAADGTIYFWAQCSGCPLFLWAVTPAGQLKWPSVYLLSDGVGSTPAIAPDGSILVATSRGTSTPARLLSISSSGVIKWSVDLADQSGVPQVAVDANGTSYVSLNAGGYNCPSWPCHTTPVLFAVNSNGSLLWSHSALLANTNVIGSAGTLYAVLLDNAPAPQNAVWRLYSFSTPVLPPPSISLVSPSSGYQGQTITNFTVSGNNFQSTSTLSFSGTGITLNSYSTRTATQIVASITIALDAPTGARDVFVTNPDGQQAARGAGFTVLANQLPVARFTVCAGSTCVGPNGTLNLSVAGGRAILVHFSGSWSFDPDGTIVNYAWAVGGAFVSGSVEFDQLLARGQYQVLLTVRDDLGAMGSANATVAITEGPPTSPGPSLPPPSVPPPNCAPALRPTEPPKFLTFPLQSLSVFVDDGWLRSTGACHQGVDYVAAGASTLPRGTAIVAAADGIAMASCEEPCTRSTSRSIDHYGNFVLIQHPNGYSTLYAHLDSVARGIKLYSPQERHNRNFSEWTHVSRGEVIGFAGDSGTFYVHLHFETALNRSGDYTGHVTHKIDPYDIYKGPEYYPPTGVLFSTCVPGHLWLGCPPTLP